MLRGRYNEFLLFNVDDFLFYPEYFVDLQSHNSSLLLLLEGGGVLGSNELFLLVTRCCSDEVLPLFTHLEHERHEMGRILLQRPRCLLDAVYHLLLDIVHYRYLRE